MIGGDAVVHEVDLPATPAVVFRMFVEPGELDRWLGLSADVDPRPGGRFRFQVAPGEYCEGEYLVVEPDARVVVTWGWTDPAFGLPPGSSPVEVTLTPTPAGTRLRLVHDRLPGDVRRIHDDGWSRFLARLHEVVAGRDPGAYPTGRPEVRRRQLREGDPP